ncbi:methyltransferase-like protein 4 isoform X1 [Scleropages formosus]|uniref:methyltransferase-like protein 4 isoform X1 n=1 Tax=Scleropages formosus TaxID=113540 RepID=UPI0010FA774E|nr:methyltransferase-like protein 4 isoform X1 [Scleropages formosus]
MSVLFQSARGWLVDQLSHANRGFERCIAGGTASRERFVRFSYKSEYFETLKPHIVDGSPRHEHNGARGAPGRGGRKRKRKCEELNQGEIDAQHYHEKVRRVILEGMESFVEAGRSCGYLAQVDGERRLLPAGPDDRLAELCDTAKQLPLVDDSEEHPAQRVPSDDESLDTLDLFTRVTENPWPFAREVAFLGETYLLPPRCSFLLSDVSRLQPLLNYGKKFDAVVLDPPWENKSVKRSNRYSSLPSSQLARLPVADLCAPDCVVATWVTNRQQHRRFVREHLYPLWGVEPQAEWLWVKVTRSGAYVFPLDSPHKKPYEVLVLGRVRRGPDALLSSTRERGAALPDLRLIVSVPCRLHSHKPSLAEVLKEFLGPNPQCLELFARNLQPDWTSWGNEVLKFQHRSYFEVMPDRPSAAPVPEALSVTS